MNEYLGRCKSETDDTFITLYKQKLTSTEFEPINIESQGENITPNPLRPTKP